MPLSAKEAAEAAEAAAQQAEEEHHPPPPSQEAAMKIQQILASAQRASLMQQAAPKIPQELMLQQASGMNGVQQMYPGMAQQFGTGAGNLSPRTGAAGIFGATATSNSFSGSSLTFSPSAPSKFTPSRCQVERGFVV